MATLHTIDLADLSLAYLQAGPVTGPLAVVLHGFPDCASSWSETLDFLGQRGFRAVAPYQRGYAPSSLPADGIYQSGAFVRDINRLYQALGGDERAVLIGHSAGAAIAYGVAAIEPTRWRRVVTISTPPTPVLLQMLLTYTQLRRSWYTFLFQHPATEMILPLNDFAFLEHLWAEWSPGFTHTDALRDVKAALSKPENLSAVLAWFRASFHPELDRPELAVEQNALAQMPTQPWLYLHGDLDQCVGTEAASLVGKNSVILAGAGHFLHLEQQEQFHTYLADFLQA